MRALDGIANSICITATTLFHFQIEFILCIISCAQTTDFTIRILFSNAPIAPIRFQGYIQRAQTRLMFPQILPLFPTTYIFYTFHDVIVALSIYSEKKHLSTSSSAPHNSGPWRHGAAAVTSSFKVIRLAWHSHSNFVGNTHSHLELASIEFVRRGVDDGTLVRNERRWLRML